MRISDWSSDVCSSDLVAAATLPDRFRHERAVAVDALVKNQIAVFALAARHPAGVLRHCHRLIRVLEITERRVGLSYRGLGERVRLREIGRASCRERVCQYV